MAKKIGSLPYGSLCFQPGEYFDCGYCLTANWRGQEVVALQCCGQAVYKADCLRKQVAVDGNGYCLLCSQPIVIKQAPEPENNDDEQ